MLKKIHVAARFTGPAFLDQLIVSGCSFALAIYLAKFWPIAAFGQFSLILVIAMLCTEIQRSFVTSPMMVFLESIDDRAAYLHSLSRFQGWLSLGLGGLCAAILYGSQFVFPKWGIASMAMPAAGFILARLQFDYRRRFFFASDVHWRAVWMDIAAGVMIVIAVILLQQQEKRYFTVDQLLLALCAVYFAASLVPGIKTHGRVPIGRMHWDYSKWLVLSVLTSFVAGDFLLMVGSATIGPKVAGTIKIGQYMMGLMIILFQALDMVIPRRMGAFVAQRDYNGLKNFLRHYMAGLLGFCTIHAIVAGLYLGPVVAWLQQGKPEVPQQETVGMAYIAFTFLLCLNYSMGYLLRAFRDTRPVFVTSFATAILNLLLAHVLIDRFGVMGVMGGYYLVQITVLVVYAVCVFRLFKRNTS